MHLDLKLFVLVRVACYDLDLAMPGVLHCIFHQIQEHPHQSLLVTIEVFRELLLVLILLLDGLAGLINLWHLRGRHKDQLYLSGTTPVQLTKDFFNFHEWLSCIESLHLNEKVVLL